MDIIDKIRGVIKEYVIESARLETRGSAYRYKHMVERLLAQYITEDQFIEAMKVDGFRSIQRSSKTFYFANFDKLEKADRIKRV